LSGDFFKVFCPGISVARPSVGFVRSAIVLQPEDAHAAAAAELSARSPAATVRAVVAAPAASLGATVASVELAMMGDGAVVPSILTGAGAVDVCALPSLASDSIAAIWDLLAQNTASPPEGASITLGASSSFEPTGHEMTLVCVVSRPAGHPPLIWPSPDDARKALFHLNDGDEDVQWERLINNGALS
jgi:hypothetical protein